ncbi:MAG TPA: BolA/IbaG family iron-sulfur metabolism protein [Gammaproteobacteria bacterium]
MDPKDIAALIEQNVPDSQAEVRTDGLGHYEAVVVSPVFEGKRSVARHRIVYAALGERVGREIHALAVRTFTPEEWQADGG